MMERSQLPQELGMIFREQVQVKRTKPVDSLPWAPLLSSLGATINSKAPGPAPFQPHSHPWVGLTSPLGSCRPLSFLYHSMNHPKLGVLSDICAFHPVTECAV